MTDGQMKKIDWNQFAIIVPDQKYKDELMEAFEHFHYSDIDTDFIAVNQLAHEYLTGQNIIVDKKLYDSIQKKKESNLKGHSKTGICIA